MLFLCKEWLFLLDYIYKNQRLFQLKKTIISERILEEDFVCNLSACKGACCVAGDAGAPLDKEEVEILKDVYPKIKSLLRSEGVAAIEKEGTATKNDFDEYETTLVNNAECAYVLFDDNNIAKCGIEEAYNKGLIDWKKPISCHLYPIRVKKFSEFEAVNYEQWDICDPACTLGASLKVPVYKFVKEALVRKFGEEWYWELEKINQKKE